MTSTRPRLVVNADDFGLSEGINAGVIGSHVDGIVTSASLIANGPAFKEAVELALAHPSLDIGVHLTLTEISPVLPADRVPTLVDARGRFAADVFELARRGLRGSLALAEVRAELDAQIRRVQARGIPISHLDGHQHVHVLPGIAGVVAELAAEHAVAAVRHPCERVRSYMLVGSTRRLAEQLALNGMCSVSPLARLKRTDAFVGFNFGGRLTERNLETVLAYLPARGTTELMCHPADAERDGPQARWGYSGTAERTALTSDKIKALIAARGIDLVAYRDL